MGASDPHPATPGWTGYAGPALPAAGYTPNLSEPAAAHLGCSPAEAESVRARILTETGGGRGGAEVAGAAAVGLPFRWPTGINLNTGRPDDDPV